MKEHGLKHFRVLVADDDSSTLNLFHQVLSRVEADRTVHLETGKAVSKLLRENASSQSVQLFDVITCQQGDEAVDAVKDSIKEDRHFSVAFIDVHMPPEPDGIRTAEHIRAIDPNIEIVIFTGFSDTHPRDIIRRVPPVHKLLYLQKPFHPREIYQFASALSMKWHTEFELQRVNKGLEESVEARIQEFKESERRFKTFLENLGDIVYQIDSSGNVTYANKMAGTITGLPLKKIIGKPFPSLFAKKHKKIAMDLYQRTLNGESLEFELTLINGKIVHFKNEPSIDKDGRIISVFGIARDITDRKHVEEALQKSEARYRAVIESQTELICRFLPDGTLTFVNDAYCRYFDRDREELIGYSFKPLIPEADRQKVFDNIASLNPNAPIISHEHRVLNSSGKIRFHKWTNQAIFDDQNNLIEYQAVGQDITERVEAEKGLKKAHNELEQQVKERTSELSKALNIIKRSEEELTQRKLTLEKLNKELMETNQALSVLARNIDKNKELLEKKIYEITRTNIIPIINELREDKSRQKRLADLDLLKTHLNGLIPGQTDHLEISATCQIRKCGWRQ